MKKTTYHHIRAPSSFNYVLSHFSNFIFIMVYYGVYYGVYISCIIERKKKVAEKNQVAGKHNLSFSLNQNISDTFSIGR